MFPIFLILIPLFKGSIFEYRLNQNYGNIIYDYSGNSYHGYMGKDETGNFKDCVFTDRGILMQTSCYIRVSSPSSSFASFQLPNPSTFVSWVNTKNTAGRLFFKYEPSSFFFIKRDSSTQSIYIYHNELGTVYGNYGPQNSFISGIFYLGQWILISLCFSGTTTSIYTNGNLMISFTISGDLLSPGSYVIGSDFSSDPGIDCFLYYFALLAEENAHSSYIAGASSNCFTASCNPCSFAMKLSYIGEGCVSDNLDETTDSEGNICSSLSCRGSLIINCLCSTESCIYYSYGNCGCIDTSTGIIESKACDCSPLDGQGCCSDNCKTCMGVNKNSCLSCYSANTNIDNLDDCTCIDGYYGTKPLTGTSSCLPCKEDCFACNSITACVSCISDNTLIVDGDCVCLNGFWNSTALISANSCMVCDLRCITCTNGFSCTECREGYYPTMTLGSDGSCIQCREDCLTCADGISCTACLATNTEIINGQCVCLDGYWNNTSLISTNSCIKCKKDCLKCLSSEICTSCVSNNTEIVNGECLCMDGYRKIKDSDQFNICIKCMSECKSCTNDTHCTECVANNAIPSKSGGCECKDFYANKTELNSVNSCYPCSNNKKSELGECLCPDFNETCISLCTVFSLKNTCISCQEGSYQYKDTCKCLKESLLMNSNCTKSYFIVKISINFNNQITLKFSKNLKKDLEGSSFSLTSSSNKETFTLYKKSDSQYIINLESEGPNRRVKIEFIQDIVSNDSSVFINKTAFIRIFDNYKNTESDSNSNDFAKNGLLLGLALSFTVGSIHLDLSHFYNLLNFGDIYSLIALYGLDIDQELLQYLINLKISKELPEFFISLIRIDTENKSEAKFLKYGYKTTIFYINSGSSILVLVALLILFQIFKLLPKRLLEKSKVLITIKNYFEYNAFIRLFIQSFLDTLLSSCHSLKNMAFNTLTTAYSIYLSLFFMIWQLYLYFYSIYLVYSRKILNDKELIEKFENKFESLFKDFRTWKTRRIFFYFTFMTRRYLLVLIIFFVEDPVLKLILSFTLSVTVIYTQVFVYLISVKCFKKPFDNIIHVINELCTILVYIFLFLSFIRELSDIKSKIRIIITVLISISLGINVIGALISFVNAVKKIFFAKKESTNKVLPVVFGISRDDLFGDSCSFGNDLNYLGLPKNNEALKPNSLRDSFDVKDPSN